MKNVNINYLELAQKIENAKNPLFIFRTSRSGMSAKITIYNEGQFLIYEQRRDGCGTERGFSFLNSVAIAANIENPHIWANEQRRKFSNFYI